MVIQYPLSCLHYFALLFSGAVEDIVSFSFANFFNIEVMKFIPTTIMTSLLRMYIGLSFSPRCVFFLTPWFSRPAIEKCMQRSDVTIPFTQ